MIFKENEKLEESLYEQVATEIINGKINQGLWLKATVESGGSEFKAKALYAKLRVRQLKREMEDASQAKAREHVEREAALISQNAKREARLYSLSLKGIFVCPNCQMEVTPKKEMRISPVVYYSIGFVLCIFFIIPGFLYFTSSAGHTNICPECNHVW